MKQSKRGIKMNDRNDIHNCSDNYSKHIHNWYY